MFRIEKWLAVNDLIYKLNHRDFNNPDEFDGKLKGICYAPNIGYRHWIYRYDGVLVVLFDEGNDHRSFFSLASRIDVVIALIIGYIHTHGPRGLIEWVDKRFMI